MFTEDAWEAQRLSSDSADLEVRLEVEKLGFIPEPTSDGHEFAFIGLTLHIKLILSLSPSVNRCLLNNR